MTTNHGMTKAKFATITFSFTIFVHTFSYEVVTELALQIRQTYYEETLTTPVIDDHERHDLSEIVEGPLSVVLCERNCIESLQPLQVGEQKVRNE